MRIQQEPIFQQYVERYLEQNKDKFLESLINKGARVPYNFDVDNKIQKQNPSQEEEIRQMKQMMEKMLQPKSSFSLDSICPNPFDKSVSMKDFPKRVEFPQYDKYDGSGDPHGHVHQFYTMSFEFHQDDSYLMRLFPRSLKGQAMEWFTNITPPVKTFRELVHRFVQHFAYNLSRSVTMLDLCNLKQNQGEPFVTFLQRWRRQCSRYPRTIHEDEKIDILVSNLVPEMRYEIKKIVFTSFDTMIDTACRIEDVLKEQGILTRHNNNTNNGQHNNKDKGKNNNWNKNKQVVNDGVVDSSQSRDQSVLNLTKVVQAMKLNAPPQQESKPRYQESPKTQKWQFTKLGDSYEDILKTLIANNLAHPQDPAKFHIPDPKPHWWDDKAFCKFHNGPGHTVENCWKLKHIVQDFIESGKLQVDGLNTNADHKAFKEPLPNYDKGETSKS